MVEQFRRIKEELAQAKKELERIKLGIRRCDTELLIDGNDMTDYGWTTHKNVNINLKAGVYDARRWPTGNPNTPGP